MNQSRKSFLKIMALSVVAASGILAGALLLPSAKRLWSDEDDEPLEFYAAGNLTKKVTIEQAESIERYSDPLGGVSAVAFGHLQKAWEAFLLQKPRKGELWAFDSLSLSESKAQKLRHRPNRGYAWVVGRAVKSEIVIEG